MKVLVNDGLKFCCSSDAEKWRARTLFTKETGTIQWLRKLAVGDVFYDIGANIGIYTIFAARQVGPSGMVYAFEPHLASAAALAENVSINRFADRVTILSVALGDSSDFGPFGYRALASGSSGHQFGSETPNLKELKYSTTIANVVAVGCSPPTAMKIDVDGNELKILNGLPNDLGGLKWLQTEVPPENVEAVNSFLASRGFQLAERHYTQEGKKQLREGVEPLQIIHNAVYERVP